MSRRPDDQARSRRARRANLVVSWGLSVLGLVSGQILGSRSRVRANSWFSVSCQGKFSVLGLPRPKHETETKTKTKTTHGGGGRGVRFRHRPPPRAKPRQNGGKTDRTTKTQVGTTKSSDGVTKVPDTRARAHALTRSRAHALTRPLARRVRRATPLDLFALHVTQKYERGPESGHCIWDSAPSGRRQ